MISVVLEEPYSGAWVADTVDTIAPTGVVTLESDVWSGAVVSTAVDGGRIFARILGGAGKLSTVLPDRWYNGTELSDTIASDMIAEAGEVLGASSLGLRVDSWQRKAGTLGECLSQLVAVAGGSWWIDRDGKVSLGTRPSTALLPSQFSRVSVDVDGSVLVNTLSKTDINPGDTWQGKVIRHIRWTLTPESLSAALAFYDLPSPALTLDYLRTYRAKVDQQNPDGTLDVIVDQSFAVSSVTWFAGLPADVTILPGDTVTLGWLGGDPQYPYARDVLQTSGGSPVARVGDTTDCGELYLQYGTGPLALAVIAVWYAPPRTDPLAPREWTPCGVPGTVIPPTPATPGVAAVSALITSGNARVKL